MRRVDWRTVAFIGVGALGFTVFLGALGARLEPPTITMILTAAALALLLHTLYRMVAALARPVAEVVVEQEAVLGGIAERELREEKRRVLRAINELQFDYDMGKLSDEDYRSVRELYELRAIEVMRALDAEPELHPRLLADLAKIDGTAKPAAKPTAKSAAEATPAESESESESESVAAQGGAA